LVKKNQLFFRVANIRKHQLIESHASLFLSYPEKTDEGETSFAFARLEIEDIGPFLSSVPTTVIHFIDEASPFHDNPRALEHGELVVLLEGIDSTTSDTTQARHSYVQHEVVYNARFADMLAFESDGSIVVDMNQFDKTMPVEPAPWHGTGSVADDFDDDDSDDGQSATIKVVN
jgi:inward rectifier potassium channel